MAEASAAALVLLPLAVLTYAALHLLRLGVSSGELSEAARQRLAGFGMMLLYLVVLAALGAMVVGVTCLFRVYQV